jgi:hypothetical protein
VSLRKQLSKERCDSGKEHSLVPLLDVHVPCRTHIHHRRHSWVLLCDEDLYRDVVLAPSVLDADSALQQQQPALPPSVQHQGSWLGCQSAYVSEHVRHI